MASRRAWEPLSQVASGRCQGAAFGSNASLPLISCLALGKFLNIVGLSVFICGLG